MAGLTLAQQEARLAAYLDAEIKALQSQSYSVQDRELQRAKLEEIRAGIKECNDAILKLSASASGRSRTRYVVPGH